MQIHNGYKIFTVFIFLILLSSNIFSQTDNPYYGLESIKKVNPKDVHELHLYEGDSIPENIDKFINLKTLYVFEVTNKEIPDGFNKLTSLEVLRFSEVLITNFTALHSLPNLKKLEFSGCSVDMFSPTQLNSLEEIRILNCDLINVPEWLKNQNKLKTIELNNNSISDLPAWIFDLENLETLSVDNNKIKSLPESINTKCAIRSLYLGSNYLTEISSSYFELDSIQLLDVTNNLIEKLPYVKKPGPLRFLEFGRNRISEIPDWICMLEKIETLDFSTNRIETINVCIAQLSKLYYLYYFDVTDNNIKEISAEFFTDKLQLEINQNQIIINSEALTFGYFQYSLKNNSANEFNASAYSILHTEPSTYSIQKNGKSIFQFNEIKCYENYSSLVSNGKEFLWLPNVKIDDQSIFQCSSDTNDLFIPLEILSYETSHFDASDTVAMFIKDGSRTFEVSCGSFISSVSVTCDDCDIINYDGNSYGYVLKYEDRIEVLELNSYELDQKWTVQGNFKVMCVYNPGTQHTSVLLQNQADMQYLLWSTCTYARWSYEDIENLEYAYSTYWDPEANEQLDVLVLGQIYQVNAIDTTLIRPNLPVFYCYDENCPPYDDMDDYVIVYFDRYTKTVEIRKQK